MILVPEKDKSDTPKLEKLVTPNVVYSVVHLTPQELLGEGLPEEESKQSAQSSMKVGNKIERDKIIALGWELTEIIGILPNRLRKESFEKNGAKIVWDATSQEIVESSLEPEKTE